MAPERIDKLVLYGTGPNGSMAGRFETIEEFRLRVIKMVSSLQTVELRRPGLCMERQAMVMTNVPISQYRPPNKPH